MLTVIGIVVFVGCLIMVVLVVLLELFLDKLSTAVEKRINNGGGRLWKVLYVILEIVESLMFW